MPAAGTPRAGGRSRSPPRRWCSARVRCSCRGSARGGTPGWAKAAATGAIIVGLVGVLLAVLTVAGVFGGHLVAPAAPASTG